MKAASESNSATRSRVSKRSAIRIRRHRTGSIEVGVIEQGPGESPLLSVPYRSSSSQVTGAGWARQESASAPGCVKIDSALEQNKGVISAEDSENLKRVGDDAHGSLHGAEVNSAGVGSHLEQSTIDDAGEQFQNSSFSEVRSMLSPLSLSP